MGVMSRRHLLYIDWMVQNIYKHICIMSTYFIFNVIGLITHPRMINGRHVLTLGTSMCMTAAADAAAVASFAKHDMLLFIQYLYII